MEIDATEIFVDRLFGCALCNDVIIEFIPLTVGFWIDVDHVMAAAHVTDVNCEEKRIRFGAIMPRVIAYPELNAACT